MPIIFESEEQRERRLLREEQDREYNKSLSEDKLKALNEILTELEETQKVQYKLTKEQTIEKLKNQIENNEANKNGELLEFVFRLWNGKKFTVNISSTLSWADIVLYFQVQALESDAEQELGDLQFIVSQTYPSKQIEYSLGDTLAQYKEYARQLLHVSTE